MTLMFTSLSGGLLPFLVKSFYSLPPIRYNKTGGLKVRVRF
jgi:hypothetical protein